VDVAVVLRMGAPLSDAAQGPPTMFLGLPLHMVSAEQSQLYAPGKKRSPARKKLKSLNNTCALIARSTVDSCVFFCQLRGRTSLQPCPRAALRHLEKGNTEAQRIIL